MKDKKAFVFDTNFIVQHKDLDKVKKLLDKDFNVYVTQVSIDERISQILIQLENDITQINNIRNKYPNSFIDLTIHPIEQLKKSYKNAVQQNYEKHFGDNIIPLQKNKTIFEKVLNRAYTKVPPFVNADGASDKGFKDTLMWLSIMDFFKNNGENEIIFVSDDGGFIKRNAEKLIVEFNETTTKTIEIYGNEYYNSYLKTQTADVHIKDTLPTVNQYRDRIQSIVGDICCVLEEDYWGNQSWERTFTSNKPFDNQYVSSFLKSLKATIKSHLFEKELSPHVVFNLDDRITEVNSTIPTILLEELVKLYEEIISKYNEHLNAFYSAISQNLNENYVAPVDDLMTDDDMPF